MSATPQQMAAKIHRTARAMGRVNREAVSAAALAGTTIVRASMTATGVPPGSRLNVGRKGVRINAGYNVWGYENATAIMTMRGPAHLVERPTKPHVIAARKRPGVRNRRSYGKKAITYPGLGTKRGFATSVQHPGTKGKFFWRDAMPEVRRVAPEAWHRAHQTAIRREFTG